MKVNLLNVAKWTLGSKEEKATPEYAISMAYNVCRAMDKALQDTPVYVYKDWTTMIRRNDDILTFAYYQAKQYKVKGEIPTPKEYAKALARLLKAKGYSSGELYEAVKKGPVISRKVDSLFSNAGYNKSRTAEDWAYLLDKHLDMVTLCYENFGSWYTGCLSVIGYTYEGVEDEWEREYWYDPFWKSVDDTLYEKGIKCSSSFLVALGKLEESEDAPHSRYPEEETVEEE